ncbi:PREDICTED: 40S ribosomal protein S12-like, partial [Fragaria vesca subsp. vesca]
SPHSVSCFASLRPPLRLKDPPLRDEAEVPGTAEPVAAAPALGEPMDLMTALQLVLRKSLAHGGLTRGHEAAQVIEKHAAQLCVLAEDCDQADYVKLVKSLCAEHNVNAMTIPSAKTLGEWSGLCKIDSEGKARKVVGCSCVVVKDFGEDTEGLHVVQEYVKSHSAVISLFKQNLYENATEDVVISYPTSTETLGRGIDIVKAGWLFLF